jgi:dTDP-4-dehydrorhamnose reductase
MVGIAIFGSTGMLGSTLTNVLSASSNAIFEFNRKGRSVSGRNSTYKFDALSNYDFKILFRGLKIDYIINCIGIVNKLIDTKDINSLQQAITVNRILPANLNEFSLQAGIPVITIGTDCVFSGKLGLYSESDSFDPTDHYGETKCDGEKFSPDAMVIRCSIIGREIKTSYSLLEWVLTQREKSTIDGYVNHLWNGVTTLHFSKVIEGIIDKADFSPGAFHLVPKDVVSKYDLIKLITAKFGRSDLRVDRFVHPTSINRTLKTNNPLRNLRFWQNGGYNEPPSIAEMILNYEDWTVTRKLQGSE